MDPLLEDGPESTGHTGEVVRPGDDRPRWIVALFVVAFTLLTAGLVAVAVSREDDSTAATTPGADTTGADTTGADTTGAATTGADTTAADVATTAATEAEVPVGHVRIAGTDRPIEASCVGQFPFAPNDTSYEVSSWFFRDDSGVRLVLDRWSDGSGGEGVDLSDASWTPVGVERGDAPGAFTATFMVDGGDVVIEVRPDPNAGTDCGDQLVTNEPGQLAFPHTRAVLDTCVDEETGELLGVTSEGGRFGALETDGGGARVRFAAPEVDGELVDDTASAVATEEQISFSGTVSDGDRSLDLAVDLFPDPTFAIEGCTEAERF